MNGNGGLRGGTRCRGGDGNVRRAGVQYGVVSITTLTGAAAAVDAITALRRGAWTVRSLQEWHAVAD